VLLAVRTLAGGLWVPGSGGAVDGPCVCGEFGIRVRQYASSVFLVFGRVRSAETPGCQS